MGEPAPKRQRVESTEAKLKTPEQLQREHEEAECAMREKQGRSVFISGLGPKASKEKVQEFFSSCGSITTCEVSRREASEAVFAFVEFETEDAVDAALKRSGALLEGMKISVQRKKSKGGAAAKEGRKKSTSVFVKFMEDEPPSQDVLYKIFEVCGTVKELRMHISNQYCFVEFYSLEAATLATQMVDVRFQVHFSTQKQGYQKDVSEVKKPSTSLFKPRALKRKAA
eukprot:TRINITY_DN26467_c0_g1_i1.p1 TRINITY_DN26467_c0_g1~~TRINITY_DN26467_c0_g1_i1.p1  ORF type:complete len:242 (+),score=93.76 TRINITY_DN26467_c0_g1_i1:47-727(+)